jgi:uncharacterized damage-inducible protein DinB
MLALIRDLVQHQAWADASLLQAIHGHRTARTDSILLNNLRNIVGVHRYFLSLFQGSVFDQVAAFVPEANIAELEEHFRHAHREQLQYVKTLTESDLKRRLAVPSIEGTDPTLAQALLQVVMHSQNHRGQCLTRLRELGGTPPTLDFVVWVKNQPGA